MRIIQLTNEQNSAKLTPYQCHGIETDNQPFHFGIRAITHDQAITIQKWLGKNATLSIRYEQKKQHWTGIITQIKQIKNKSSEHFFNYHLSMHHPFFLLKFTQHNRFFKDKTAIEILAHVAQENSLSLSTSQLIKHVTKIPYCVQFNEIDFDFFCRVASENKLCFTCVNQSKIILSSKTDLSETQHIAQDYSNTTTPIHKNFYKQRHRQKKQNASRPNKAAIFGLHNAFVLENQRVCFPWFQNATTHRLIHSHPWGNRTRNHAWLAQPHQEAFLSYDKGQYKLPLVSGKSYHSQNAPLFALPNAPQCYGIRTLDPLELKFDDHNNTLTLNSQQIIESNTTDNQHWRIKNTTHLRITQNEYHNTTQKGQYNIFSRQISLKSGSSYLSINTNKIELNANHIHVRTK